MDRKITFQHMPHSDPMEQHAQQKLNKIEELLPEYKSTTPFHAELWLKANKQHAHHHAELHLKTPNYSLDAHDEKNDMYAAIDCVIDKMVTLIKKAKSKQQDKNHKPENEKHTFREDKFTLSE